MNAMTQQVNLLIDDLRPRHVLLNAAQALTCVVTIGGLLIALSFYQLVAVSRVDDQRMTLTDQLAALANANAKVRASINAVEDPQLAAGVADLRAQLQSRTLLEAALTGTANGRTEGFSGHFDELAENGGGGLWLTDFELSDGGERIRLAGMTLDPVLVPRFLQSLGDGTQFSGHQFDVFELAAGDGGALHFTIGPDQELP